MPLGATVLALLVVSVALAGTLPGHAIAPRAGSGGLTLTANRTSGYAPLSVAFSVTLPPNATPTRVAWTFGDGGTLNGTGDADLDPVHEYVVEGQFAATVNVTWPAGSENASLPIHVLQPTLVVAKISVNLTNGTAPLSVEFLGSATGGTGTFVGFVWSFGDGGNGTGPSVTYTYDAAGRFPVSLVVTDSRGDVGRAGAWVNVSAAPPNATKPNGSNGSVGSSHTPPKGPGEWLGLPAVVWWGVLGAGALAVVVAGVRLFSLRRARAASRGPTEQAPSSAAGPVPPPLTRTGPVPPAAAIVPGPGSDPEQVPSRVTRERQIANRLVRHLAALPRLAPGDVPDAAWTQSGIASALSVGQSAVSRVLGQLERSGIVAVTTEHVVGGPRRVKVYRLTPRGERLGHALREAGDPGRPGP